MSILVLTNFDEEKVKQIKADIAAAEAAKREEDRKKREAEEEAKKVPREHTDNIQRCSMRSNQCDYCRDAHNEDAYELKTPVWKGKDKYTHELKCPKTDKYQLIMFDDPPKKTKSERREEKRQQRLVEQSTPQGTTEQPKATTSEEPEQVVAQ